MPFFRPLFVRKLLALLAIIGVAAPTVVASEFVGDLTMKSARRTLVGRIHVKDSLYRMDFSQGAGQTFIIVNQATDECFVADAKAKTYRVVSALSPQVLQNDPFQAARVGDSLGIREYRGVDTLHGFATDRYNIKLGHNPIMTEWVAQNLDFPIRIENLMSPDSAYAEITNIAVGPVDSVLFVVPEDYREQKPEPAKNEPPGGARAGDTVIVRLDTTLAVEVALINLDEGGSECTVELLKGGELLPEGEIGPVAARTFRHSAVGEQTRRIYDTAADEIRVLVTKGEVVVDISQSE